MSQRTVLTPALAGLAAAVTLSAAASAARPPRPTLLVLRQVDVGRAYTGRGTRVSNADAARGGPPGFDATLARWGRIDGYEVEFTRDVSAATLQEGPVAITSSASVYRDAEGAHSAFRYGRRRLVPAGYVPLALGFAIGEEARQWVREAASGVGAMLQYLLVWRDRNVDASILVTGRVGVVSAATLAPLARRQKTRIRAAR